MYWEVLTETTRHTSRPLSIWLTYSYSGSSSQKESYITWIHSTRPNDTSCYSNLAIHWSCKGATNSCLAWGHNNNCVLHMKCSCKLTPLANRCHSRPKSITLTNSLICTNEIKTNTASVSSTRSLCSTS